MPAWQARAGPVRPHADVVEVLVQPYPVPHAERLGHLPGKLHPARAVGCVAKGFGGLVFEVGDVSKNEGWS